MHILYFHQHFTTPSGSGATRSYEFAKALIAHGHKVTIVCGLSAKANLPLTPPNLKGVRMGVVEGINIIALPLHYSNHDSVFRRTIIFLKYAFSSVSLALRLDYDIAFATSTPLTAAIPGIAARLLRRKKFIFEVRDLWPELPRAMGMKNPILLLLMWILEGVAYKSSQACIGLAPGIVDGIARRSPTGHPIKLIPNGCDTVLFAPEKKAKISIEGIFSGDFVAGFTGAHGKANGLGVLIDVAVELQKIGRSDIKILLIGDGAEKPILIKRASHLGLNNIIFHPPIPKYQLATITASLDCGLMLLANIPAFYQGTSPNKFFDYISSGIPVVINYPGWICDIIDKNEIGLSVPPSSPVLLAQALVKLSIDLPTRVKMGAASRLLAENVYSREISSDSFVKWIEAHA